MRFKEKITNTITLVLAGTLIILVIANLPKSCKAQKVSSLDSIIDTIDWKYNDYYPLNFENIYYFDTINMVIYYDDYDQFDMEHEYEKNPDNINEDGNLMIHISEGNMIELVNKMLQWIDCKERCPKSSEYAQSLFSIKEIDGQYWVVYKYE